MIANISIGNKVIGEGQAVFVIAEIGINHNGSVDVAKKLIDVAVTAGCDAVKFQKRCPEQAVPECYKEVKRDTPWGVMTYLEYRKKVEFDESQYRELSDYCSERGVLWAVSCWDCESVDFIDEFDVSFLKVPSALLTDEVYLEKIRSLKMKKQLPLIMSTGMSDLAMIKKAVSIVGRDNIVLLHAVSAYPTKAEDIHLRCMSVLQEAFECPVGYSGHETGLQVSVAAAALGAVVIERHITLDRSMWGSDQAASLEPGGLSRLVRDIRIIERALGAAEIRVHEVERAAMKRLRKL